MPDGLESGVGFAARLAANVYGLHKQDQDQQRAEAENQRRSMMSILEGAANSGNVNPEDMPQLYAKLFELSGAKSKEISMIMPHLQSAFTQLNTPRQVTTQGPDTTVPAEQPSEGAPDYVPSYTVPGVPQISTVNTPAIRMMGPEERAAAAGRAQAAQLKASYPQRQSELDDATQRKLDLQGASLDAREKARIRAITVKGGIDATKKFNERVSMFMMQAGGDLEVAKGLASKSLIADEDAALAAKQQQVATGKARAQYLSGQLAVHQKNADTLSRRVDLQVKALEEASRHNKATEANAGGGKGSGGAVGRNLKVLMANTKELYTALTPLNNAIVKLETDPLNKESDGTLIAEVKTQVDDLKARRDAIQTKLDTARQIWLPQMPEPTDSGVPQVPQVSSGSRSATLKGVIRRGNLNAVRGQNPALLLQHPEFAKDDNALMQYLQLQGYVVK